MCVFMSQVCPECTPTELKSQAFPKTVSDRDSLSRPAVSKRLPTAIDARSKVSQYWAAVIRKKFRFGVEKVEFRYRMCLKDDRFGGLQRSAARIMKQFLQFRLDVVNQCLWRREDNGKDRRIRLTPKAFEFCAA